MSKCTLFYSLPNSNFRSGRLSDVTILISGRPNKTPGNHRYNFRLPTLLNFRLQENSLFIGKIQSFGKKGPFKELVPLYSNSSPNCNNLMVKKSGLKMCNWQLCYKITWWVGDLPSIIKYGRKIETSASLILCIKRHESIIAKKRTKANLEKLTDHFETEENIKRRQLTNRREKWKQLKGT